MATLAIGKKLTNDVQVDNAALEAYKGKYEMTAKTSRIVLIKVLEGKLIIEVTNEWKAELLSTKRDAEK